MKGKKKKETQSLIQQDLLYISLPNYTHTKKRKSVALQNWSEIWLHSKIVDLPEKIKKKKDFK